MPAHGDAVGGEVVFCLQRGLLGKMEDAGGGYGAGTTFTDGLEHVRIIAGSARGDDGDFHGGGDFPDEIEVIALHGAVALDGGDKNFSGTESFKLGCPRGRMKVNGFGAAVAVALQTTVRHAACVDAGDDALRAEPRRCLLDEFRMVVGGAVDAYFVGSGSQQLSDVRHAADAAADGERHETFGGEFGYGFVVGLALLRSGGDVHEDELVHLTGVVRLDGWPHGTEAPPTVEADAFDQAEVLRAQGGDDTGFQHRSRARKLRMI